MELNETTVNNVLDMLLSSDKENGYIAFKSLESIDFEINDFAWLIYLFKFSRIDKSEWEKNAPKCFKVISKYHDFNQPLTYAKGLATMVNHRCNSNAISCFLNRHVVELTEMLDNMGYPIEHLEFKLQLKDGQTTESK